MAPVMAALDPLEVLGISAADAGDEATLRDAWKRALTVDRVREAGSVAAEQTQAMAAQLAALAASDAARNKELETLRSQVNTLKSAKKPASMPPTQTQQVSPYKVSGLARKALQVEKGDCIKALGAKRRALAAAADADKPAVQTDIDGLVSKLNDVNAKLAEKA